MYIIYEYESDMSDKRVKENRCVFRYVLAEILQINTVHKLPHRAQFRSIFQNRNPLNIRRGTVLNFTLNTSFACSKRKSKWVK